MFTPGPPNPWAYTRRQRLGLVALVVLIAAAAVLTPFLRSAPDLPAADDAALFAAAERLRTAADRSLKKPNAAARPATFAFDPNAVSAADLRRLGLSEKQATAWIKYRQKRPFRAPEDIGRLFVLRPSQVDHLLPLATFPEIGRAPVAESPTYTTRTVQRFPFDPNSISADSLQLLGLSEREAGSLIRYRGDRPLTFRRPEDLLRIRSIDSNKVLALLDLVTIDVPTPPAPARRRPPTPPATVDINAASPEEWEQLPGIGPYRARKIVEWRDQLGGFADMEQVADTYQLPDSTFTAIRPYLRVRTPPATLSLNLLSARELARHPYLDRRTATILVRYRENHGPFAGPADLEKVRALSTEKRERLLPYLNFAP